VNAKKGAQFVIGNGRLALVVRGDKTFGSVEYMGGRLNVMLGHDFQGRDGLEGTFQGSIAHGKSGVYFILEAVHES